MTISTDKSNLNVRIHAHLADGGNSSVSQGHSSVMLWYLVRAFDIQGSGRVSFNLEEAATLLNRSVPSIRRYLRQGKQLGFFRNFQVQGTIVKVYYQGLFKVCQKLGLESWGAVAEIEISDLNNLKLIATQIETQRLQESSRYNAQQEHRNVASDDDIFPSSQCSSGARGIIHRGERCLFVNELFAAFGASQRSIASKLGRCDRTIRKRLSNRTRIDRGLKPIDRVQIAQTTPELNQRFGLLFDQFDRSEIKECDGIWKTGFSDRIFKSCDRVFKSICNLYSKDLILLSMRRSRSLFNRFKRGLSDQDSLGVPLIK